MHLDVLFIIGTILGTILVTACPWRPKRSMESRWRLPTSCPVGSLEKGVFTFAFWIDLDGIQVHFIHGFGWVLMDCEFRLMG